MESVKFEEKDFFQPYTSAHKLLLVSANFVLSVDQKINLVPLQKQNLQKLEISILTFESLQSYKKAISKMIFHFQVINSI